MDKDEKQRPEGRLVQDALRASGRSARNASAEIGISDSRLRHIIRGYQPVGHGQVVDVIAPADTLARIAYVLGISEAELTDAGRADAAEAMEASRRRDLAARFKWPLDQQRRVEARLAAEAWFRVSLDAPAPRELLRVIPNDDLLAELRRRLLETAADPAAGTGAFAKGAQAGLSAVPDEVPDAVAAHEEEGSIAGEQEESDTP